MHVLVTGGAGYIGFSLVRELAGRPDVERLTVIDNLARRNYALFVSGSHGPSPVAFRQTDLLDGHSLDTLVADADIVVHLAGHAVTPQSDGHHHVFDQVNNWGTAQLARSIEKSTTTHTIVNLSSFAVYDSSETPIDASTVPAPRSSYGASKLAGEAHLQRLAGPGRRVLTLRAGNVFGFNPAIRFDAVVNAMCFAACTAGRVRINGDGTQQRPFIDVATLARTISGLFDTSTDDDEVLRVASDNASVNEIAELLSRSVPDLEYISTPQLQLQTFSMGDLGAVSERAGVTPTPFAEAVSDLVNALRP